MAIARDTDYDCDGTSSATFPGGRTASAGDLLVACVRNETVHASISMSGFTKKVGVDLSTVFCGAIFFKIATGGETGCSVTGASTARTQLFRYTGAAASSVDDKSASNAGGSQVQTLATGTTASTSQPDELIIMIAALDGAVTIGANPWANGELLRSQAANGFFTGQRIVTAVGTYSDTATWTTNRFPALAIATFKAAEVVSSTMAIL